MALKLPEILTEEDLVEVVEKTKKPHHKLAFMLGFYECMRIGEIVKLKQENIHRGLKEIHIKLGKGGKDRNISISPKVWNGLKFIPISCGVRALQYAFKKKCKEVLERDDLKFHSLRHSGITHYLVKEGWDGLMVQRLAGHSSIKTTMIYTHISPQDLVGEMWKDVKI